MTTLAALAAAWFATKLLGDLAQRIKQPAVLGELLAGVLLGASVFGVLDPADPFIHQLSELGVIVLLFTIGLETELASLVRVGSAATMVAVTGVVLPMVSGYYVGVALGLETVPALVCGAALCATSVGITGRVLSDIGWLESTEGKVILGAAVIDDVIGLIILAVIASVVAGGTPTVASVSRLTGVAVAFVAAAVLIGGVVAKPLFGAAERLKAEGALGTIGLVFAIVLAWLAEMAGSAMIVGAFSAGLVLHGLPQRKEIQRTATSLGHLVVPLFFASVGAAVSLGALADSRSLALGAALVVTGIVGKLLAGVGAWRLQADKTLIGIGMVPRGEVGLIFAQMGLAAGAVTAGQYGALMLMVLITTFVTPPALAWRARHVGRRAPATDRPGDGGVDDLVAGTRKTGR